jgi:hypothetical protein
MAAKNCLNLSDKGRYSLVLDDVARAKAAGVSTKHNDL